METTPNTPDTTRKLAVPGPCPVCGKPIYEGEGWYFGHLYGDPCHAVPAACKPSTPAPEPGAMKRPSLRYYD